MFYKRISGSGDLVLKANTRLLGVRLESAAADSTAIIYDAITQTLGASGDKQICKLAVTAVATYDAHPKKDQIMFTPNGISVEKGISVTLSGSSAILYIYYS